jgi:hypothetical protein
LGVSRLSRFPDLLGLNQSDRTLSLLGVCGVEEQDRFEVPFLVQDESSGYCSALTNAKCGIEPIVIRGCFERDTKHSRAVLVDVPKLATQDRVTALIARHSETIFLGKFEKDLVAIWSQNPRIDRCLVAWRWSKGNRISGTCWNYRSFDPHRPYQLSHSLHRTCDFREAAKGSNKSEARRQIACESRGTDGKPTKSPHSTGSRDS